MTCFIYLQDSTEEELQPLTMETNRSPVQPAMHLAIHQPLGEESDSSILQPGNSSAMHYFSTPSSSNPGVSADTSTDPYK